MTGCFSQTDRAIILEDDCLAHPSFFPYCDELLERYHDDERIMQIAGSNFHRGQVRGAYSYFFSRFKICWGWATWRRAWRHMDMSVRLWPELRNTPWLLDIAGDPRLAQHWSEKLDLAHLNAGNIDYWDYQWMFATWAHNGLCIKPEVNMISNIGFGKDATHTTWTGNKWANLPFSKMFFPLLHPPFVVRNKEADDYFVQQVVAQEIPQPKQLHRRIYNKVRRLMPQRFPRQCECSYTTSVPFYEPATPESCSDPTHRKAAPSNLGQLLAGMCGLRFSQAHGNTNRSGRLRAVQEPRRAGANATHGLYLAECRNLTCQLEVGKQHIHR